MKQEDDLITPPTQHGQLELVGSDGKMRIMALYGQARSEREGGGPHYHAVSDGAWHALCGREPGRRSAGWIDHPDFLGKEVTCPKCLKKMMADTTP